MSEPVRAKMEDISPAIKFRKGILLHSSYLEQKSSINLNHKAFATNNIALHESKPIYSENQSKFSNTINQWPFSMGLCVGSSDLSRELKREEECLKNLLYTHRKRQS